MKLFYGLLVWLTFTNFNDVPAKGLDTHGTSTVNTNEIAQNADLVLFGNYENNDLKKFLQKSIQASKNKTSKSDNPFENKQYIVPGPNSVQILLTRTGQCFINDRRDIRFKTGRNYIIFEGLPNDIEASSINFRLIKKENISQLKWCWHPSNTLRNTLLMEAIGSSVTFLDSNKKIDTGTLDAISEDIAFITHNGQTALVRVDDVKDINEKFLKKCTRNFIALEFDSTDVGNSEVEISYLINKIKIINSYDVIVGENLKNVTIIVKNTIINDTNHDFYNAQVLLNNKGSVGEFEYLSDKDYESFLIDLQSFSSVVRQKTVSAPKYDIEYLLQVSKSEIEGKKRQKDSVTMDVFNVLWINPTINAMPFMAGEGIVNLFYQDALSKKFVQSFSVQQLLKDNKLAIKLGRTNTVTADMQLTDINKNNSRQEYGLRLSLRNYANNTVNLTLSLDQDIMIYKVRNDDIKSKDDSNLVIQLQPNEVKELHFRVVLQKNKKEN